MAYKIVILGASYGSLLGTKLLMAGQDVTLVCRQATADLINAEGTEVRIKLRDEAEHRSFNSNDLPGNLDAKTPEQVNPDDYDMVALAMSEPQYCNDSIVALLGKIAASKKPCLSIMNMPPLPYLRRIKGLDASGLEDCFTCPSAWSGFEPGVVTLCSPDPQAYRVPEEGPNTLHVGLPTNFKAAPFESDEHNAILRDLEAGIDQVRVDGKEVPVKLRVFDSLFVPFAKWSMLLTGNYRCVLSDGARPIKEAVHEDVNLSERIYEMVNEIVGKLGADAKDAVPFEKYANAANGLLKPSSAARAIEGGADRIERVDMLVNLIADQVGLSASELSGVVETVNARLEANRKSAA
ncbi:ketopantoate reductase family protein [Primorskyibacter sp. S87]|uniref:ketopantoate reductase family protein n=1 Tax=Primorskyibacter sp. S87 TaxID=3415126 RepID=UPI003C7DC546